MKGKRWPGTPPGVRSQFFPFPVSDSVTIVAVWAVMAVPVSPKTTWAGRMVQGPSLWLTFIQHLMEQANIHMYSWNEFTLIGRLENKEPKYDSFNLLGKNCQIITILGKPIGGVRLHIDKINPFLFVLQTWSNCHHQLSMIEHAY